MKEHRITKKHIKMSKLRSKVPQAYMFGTDNVTV